MTTNTMREGKLWAFLHDSIHEAYKKLSTTGTSNEYHALLDSIAAEIADGVDARFLQAAQSVPVVGDLVAITGEPIAILRREIGEDTWFDWTPVEPNSESHRLLRVAGAMDYCEVYQRYAQSIPAAELASLRTRLEQAEDVLRTLASELGAGGYNAESVDAEVFERKIRDGVNMLLNPLVNRLEQAEKERDELRKDAERMRAEASG